MFGQPDSVSFYYGGERSNEHYFRVPVRPNIPIQCFVRAHADDRLRSSERGFVKGARVRFKLESRVDVEVSGICYDARSQKEVIPMAVAAGELPSTFSIGRKEKACGSRLLTLSETNFLSSKDSPFNVLTGPNGMAMLDSPAQRLFTARLAKGAAGLVGKAEWDEVVGGAKVVRRGRRYHQQFLLNGPMCAQAVGGMTRCVLYHSWEIEVYFDIKKEVELGSTDANGLVFDPPFEIMFEVKPLVTVGHDVDARDVEGPQQIDPMVGGHVSNLMLNLYFTS